MLMKIKHEVAELLPQSPQKLAGLRHIVHTNVSELELPIPRVQSGLL